MKLSSFVKIQISKMLFTRTGCYSSNCVIGAILVDSKTILHYSEFPSNSKKL
jgi:hypothetical protein